MSAGTPQTPYTAEVPVDPVFAINADSSTPKLFDLTPSSTEEEITDVEVTDIEDQDATPTPSVLTPSTVLTTVSYLY